VDHQNFVTTIGSRAMQIRVKLFAIVKERAGVGELSLKLRDGANVAAAAVALKEELPAIAGFLDRSAFAVNREYVDAATVLHDGDEIAVIPPVSGG
jgi:molybdopterin converting factor subunit 1